MYIYICCCIIEYIEIRIKNKFKRKLHSKIIELEDAWGNFNQINHSYAQWGTIIIIGDSNRRMSPTSLLSDGVPFKIIYYRAMIPGESVHEHFSIRKLSPRYARVLSSWTQTHLNHFFYTFYLFIYIYI